VSQWTFRYWRKKAEASGAPQPRPARAAPAIRRLNFVPARLVETGPTPIEVALAGGRSLRVRGDFDPAVLRKLVATLEAAR
jgi:hypothetical protein